MNIITRILEVAATLSLISVGGLAVYLLFFCLPKLKNTLNSIQNIVDTEVKETVSNIDGTIIKINSELLPEVNKSVVQINEELMPQINDTIENLNSTATMLQDIRQTEIQPITNNIQEITDKLASDVAQIDQTVNFTLGFVETTIKKAEFCREQLIVPVVEIASFWTGLKVGFSKLFDKLGGKNNE